MWNHHTSSEQIIPQEEATTSTGFADNPLIGMVKSWFKEKIMVKSSPTNNVLHIKACITGENCKRRPGYM
jgi:hypothetical protein